MEIKDTHINIRVSTANKARLQALADEYEMKLSDFILLMAKFVERTKPVLKARPSRRPQPAAVVEAASNE